jgi:CMP-N-acetylneuraminic acid synthetase
MILGHVGARKGSKGVPRKNFRDLHGKPLIGWSLDQLLEHPMIDAVVVSTDDEEIYEHAVAKAKADKGSSRPRQFLRSPNRPHREFDHPSAGWHLPGHV